MEWRLTEIKSNAQHASRGAKLSKLFLNKLRMTSPKLGNLQYLTYGDWQIPGTQLRQYFYSFTDTKTEVLKYFKEYKSVTSRNTHVTLLTKPRPVPNLSHPLSHPLALVPPRNSSALEALLSQLHTDSRDSRNLVPRSNSGITNADLNITISSLVPVPVPVLILVPVPVPCSDIAFLCFPSCTHHFPVFQSVFRYVPVPKAMLSDLYI